MVPLSQSPAPLPASSSATVPSRLHWYRSSADNTRLKLFTPGGIALFTLAMSMALVAAYPFQDLAARLAKGGKADLLTVAYLRGWLRAEPGKLELNATLARQLQMIGDYPGAFAALKPLLDSVEPEQRKTGLRLEIDILRHQAWALEERDPRRAEILALANDKLLVLNPPRRAKTTNSASSGAQGSDSNEASESGDAEPPRQLSLQEQRESLIQLANAPPPDADYSWFSQHARALLGHSLYRLSADMNWRAFAVANTAAQRRESFDNAVATLQAGNMSAIALEQLDSRLKLLQPDPLLYKRLVRLAMAAGKLDVAERYAKLMLKLSLLEQLQRWQQSEVRSDAPNRLEEFNPAYMRRVNSAGSASLPLEGSSIKPNGTEQPGPGLAFDEESYRLGFEVFMARGKQTDALRIAKSAVKQAPGNMVWLKRVAQLNEWTGNPIDALNTWFDMAKLQGNAEHWGHVKRLSVMLLDMDKQLAALQWEYLQKSSPDAAIANAIAIAKLYEDLGKPNDAVDWLDKAFAQHTGSTVLMQAMIALLDRMDNQTQLVKWLPKAIKLQPELALNYLRLAIVLTERGDSAEALNVLLQGKNAALATSDPKQLEIHDGFYWTYLAHAARTKQRDAIAIDALLISLRYDRMPEAELRDFIHLAESSNADLAIALAHYANKRYNAPSFLRTATQMLARRGDLHRLTRLFEELPQKERNVLESDVNFLAMRANLLLANSSPDAAMRDIKKALALAPDNHELIAQSLWLAISSRDSQTLRQSLHRWEADSRSIPALWGAFGAAWMALHEPHKARPYFVRQAKLKPDFLWNLTLADCLEQTGLPDAAWGLRRQAWTEMNRQVATRNSPELQQQIAVLAMQFANGDATRRLLNRVLVDMPVKRRPATPLITENSTTMDLRRSIASAAMTGALTGSSAAGDASRRIVEKEVDELLSQVGHKADSPSQVESDLRRIWQLSSEAEKASNNATSNTTASPAKVNSKANSKSDSKTSTSSTNGSHTSGAAASKREATLKAQELASAKELALSFFLSNEQVDLAKAWLVSNYASAMQRPVWAELNIALAQKDKATLVRLLDSVPDWLPKLDRIEALQKTGQLAQAQSLAFEMAQQRPDSHEVKERLAQLLDENASQVRFTWSAGNQSSVDYFGPRFESRWRLSNTFTLNANLSSSTIQNRDNGFPSALSTRETQTEIGLDWLRDSGRIGLSLLNRSSITESTGLKLDWRENFDSQYNLHTVLRWRAPNSDTQGIRVFGYADQFQASGRFDITRREYLGAQLVYSNYGIEGHGSVARGLQLNAEAGHKLRLEYPDVTAKLNLAMGRYKENARLQAAATHYLPNYNPSMRSLFVPSDSNSLTANIGFGSTARERTQGGGITPFGEFAYIYDSQVGNGYNAALGLTTSLFGNDRLFLGGTFTSATPANPRPSKEFSAGYRYRF